MAAANPDPNRSRLLVRCQRCQSITFTIAVQMPAGILVICCGCGLEYPGPQLP